MSTHENELDQSVQRLAKSEDDRARTTGYGTTLQGQALTRKHRERLASRIGEDRTGGRVNGDGPLAEGLRRWAASNKRATYRSKRDRDVWRALKGFHTETLAV